MNSAARPLGELANIVSGFAFSSEYFNDSGLGLPLVRIRDVLSGKSETHCSGEYRDDFIVNDGDALIGMDGEFNLGLWRGGRALLNQRVCKVQSTSDDLDQEYLLRFLRLALKKIEEKTPFVTVKHLSVKDLREVLVPLPSVAEQRRIAAILNRTDALLNKRRQSIAKLNQLLQSVFVKTFGVSDSWRRVAVGEMCDVKGGKRLPNGESYSSAVTPFRYIRVSDIKMGEIHQEGLKYLTSDVQDKIRRYTVRAGDVVITIAGTIGVVASVSENLSGANLTENAAKLVSKGVIDYEPDYLAFALSSDDAQSQIQSRTGHVTIGKLALFRIEKLEIPLPPIDLQRKFIAFRKSILDVRSGFVSSEGLIESLSSSLQKSFFS